MLRRIAILSLSSVALACGGASPAATSAAGPAPQANASLRRDRNTILFEDMQKAEGVNNLYDVVQRLHPEWLKKRAGYANARDATGDLLEAQVEVYFDGQRSGGAEMLKTMPVRGITALRFYSASDAQAKFGNGNMAAAIQVITATK